MTPALKSLAAALLALSALATPAMAATDFRPAGSQPIITTDVTMVQQAAMVVPRDRITATLSVTLRGPDARQIQIDINRKMITALARVKTAPSVIAETGSYSVSHPYTSQGQSSSWQGEQTITLTSGDVEAVLNLAGMLQVEGLVMGEMRFFVSPDTLRAVQDELTANALKEMQGRAANIAGDMELKVIRFKLINVGNAQEQIGATPTSTKGPVAGQRSKAPPPTAIAGEALVTLTVNATALLAP